MSLLWIYQIAVGLLKKNSLLCFCDALALKVEIETAPKDSLVDLATMTDYSWNDVSILLCYFSL